jgi:TonB family protein
MRDGVAEVLAQRAALDRGAATGVVLSLVLHAALIGGVYAAMHHQAPASATMVNIQFAGAPAAPRSAPAVRAPEPVPAKPAEAPAIEEPKPVIEEPKPVAEKPAATPEKNTVPLSPFGRSTKKGSETPATVKPAEAPAAPAPGTTTDIPVGGSGVTGLEGGDFPYTLYIQGMHRRIGSNWFRPQNNAGTPAIVYFRIQRDGTVADAKIETSSGNPTFDRAALSAVRSSSPLNPLPYGYSGTYLGVHLTFR